MRLLNLSRMDWSTKTVYCDGIYYYCWECGSIWCDKKYAENCSHSADLVKHPERLPR